jgi:hypothetical protein
MKRAAPAINLPPRTTPASMEPGYRVEAGNTFGYPFGDALRA